MSSHIDPEDLALRALGEQPPDPGADEHLATCQLCIDELEQLRAVVSVARSIEPADAPVEAPARVWDAVVAELGLQPALDAAAQRNRPRWPRTALVAAAAAVLGLVAGGVGALVLTADDPAPARPVEARAALAPQPGYEGTGRARLRTDDGRRVLEVDVSGLPAGAGLREVWLLDPGATRLVSLGLLDGGRGVFTLPAAVDVADLSVVDVSIEPADGNPAHSGDSVVRGVLRG